MRLGVPYNPEREVERQRAEQDRTASLSQAPFMANPGDGKPVAIVEEGGTVKRTALYNWSVYGEDYYG